ncbi:Oidioi.mRNA.OKI2018_I69.XSR.g13555.t1.cds [Oikopleura dioica]|uniref:Oidioi.mRNA.OKI2018_I69.XSR.g13555.t1.cds n=1 Tax=Oikopleura dioica TaxID=34765 RepID=A0ABN7S7Q2_OIKDI|nr:Oidioi.mRNA.OKI2018_I69.XSR.g13555.t1.cds [Oikopleura dioica]
MSFFKNIAGTLPTPISVVFAAGSWASVNWRKSEINTLEKRKAGIEKRLNELYGPLYGNRMLFRASIGALEKKVGTSVSEHLKEVERKRLASELENWRDFYRSQLRPLDIKVNELILLHSDCIVDEESMARIKAFAEKSAENNYTMEHWRADGEWDKRSQFDSKDFDYSNSNGDMEEHELFEEHVLSTYRGKGQRSLT